MRGRCPCSADGHPARSTSRLHCRSRRFLVDCSAGRRTLHDCRGTQPRRHVASRRTRTPVGCRTLGARRQTGRGLRCWAAVERHEQLAGRISQRQCAPPCPNERCHPACGARRRRSWAKPLRHRLARHHPLAHCVAPGGCGDHRVGIPEGRSNRDAHRTSGKLAGSCFRTVSGLGQLFSDFSSPRSGKS